MRAEDYEPNSDHYRVAVAARHGRARLWLPYVVTLVMLGAVFVWGAVIYDQLPELMPTGWGPDGEVRGWTEKSFGSVFTTAIIASGLFILMAALGAMAPMMSPGSPDLSAWELLRLTAGHRGITEYLGWVTALITLMMVGFNAQSWRLAASDGTWSAPVTMLLVVALVVAIFVILSPVFRSHLRWADRTAEQLGIHPTEEEAAEDALWLPSGLYNDPSNPAMMVPKREGYGIGTTVNVGSRKGRIAVIVFAVVIIAPLLIIGFTM
ncbi:DUF1648 domain-containing protein [Citricoccus muralis]|uniref:DUF1648 domain-containing protein n=1 Tax=Citricoccus muralis TaxID=169134 RepID=A0ABY8H714_9MICC|nr:DUF1648 domain-containing protein [Citricoccus muralis]WFP16940.1 DUF1648 domain-containing protein [Citricoccus muralis]